MNGKYQDKGWFVVVKEVDSGPQKDRLLVTEAMQQGVGVFVRMMSTRKDLGSWISDPIFVRNAMLEAVEPLNDGEIDVGGLVRIVPTEPGISEAST